jgi:23S rRNA pseudouridine1911/1915/1917 synthase
MRKLRVDEKSVGLRADVFITSKYPDLTRSSISKLFDMRLVNMSGHSLKSSHLVKLDDVIEVDETLIKARPAKIEVPIIYQDDNVVVINKPAGILTHSKGGFNNEATVASFIAPMLDSSLSGNRAGIVHRLDRATSGVIICARNASTQSFLQKQFGNRKVKKIYHAVVEGTPEPEEAIIDAPIERNPKKPQTFRVSSDGKSAQTHYKVLKILDLLSIPSSLLELRPTTGRTHQLRVHLNYIKHPIVGDSVYGRPAEHMLLHASSLEVTIPKSERRVFKADLPEYFNV